MMPETAQVNEMCEERVNKIIQWVQDNKALICATKNAKVIIDVSGNLVDGHLEVYPTKRTEWRQS